MIKLMIGMVLIVLGILLGIYLGVYLCFIKGILQFFQSIYPINLIGLAWGIIKVVLASLVGWGICYLYFNR